MAMDVDVGSDFDVESDVPPPKKKAPAKKAPAKKAPAKKAPAKGKKKAVVSSPFTIQPSFSLHCLAGIR